MSSEEWLGERGMQLVSGSFEVIFHDESVRLAWQASQFALLNKEHFGMGFIQGSPGHVASASG